MGNYMHWGDWSVFNTPWAVGSAVGFIIILALWSLVWKGLGLWHASRRGQPVWFGVMLVINTAGILEIIYLFGVAKLKARELFTNKK